MKQKVTPVVESRSLDVLVAAKVMGWTWRDGTEGPGWYARAKGGKLWRQRPERGGWDDPEPESFAPSRDMAAAWEVVKAIRARGFWFSLTQDSTDIWDAKIWRGEESGWFPTEEHYGNDESAPRAICVAALRAVGRATPTGETSVREAQP